jgi:hypothetical protein
MVDNRMLARVAAVNRFRELQSDGHGYASAMAGAIERGQVIEPKVDVVVLRAEIDASVSVVATESRVLLDPTQHVPWFDAKRQSAITWRFWERYRDYLCIERGFPDAVIKRLHADTNELLGYLEDPLAVDRDFDIRGLVMGNVQSGKTTNYSALINKAIDAGYKLIVVLAGLHNNLRSQTQARLDAEVLGRDTAVTIKGGQEAVDIGVMKIPGAARLFIHNLTDRTNGGDFSRRVAQQVMVQPGGDPILLVVKKNESVLRNLVRYYRDYCPASAHDPATGRRSIRNVPVLVIDDEADQASINTNVVPLNDDGQPVADHSPTQINRRIREFLRCFSQSAYVGYTATPYANVFIHHEAAHRDYGDDLFPRNFIVALSPPSNYIGPQKLLGGADPNDVGQPVFRLADDGRQVFPDGHNQSLDPHEVPESLKAALLSFVLSSAMRRARGQSPVHNSMLIHVTRFQVVQRRVAELVRGEVTTLRHRLRFGDGAGTSLLDEFHDLYVRDFAPTSGSMNAAVVSWDDSWRHINNVVDSLAIRVINGRSEDLLDYEAPLTENRHLIVIGGDKLSRGLTLEGLTVSYFLRSSKMYDTLMQMGRWFGYRPGYEDLCRIYAPTDLTESFRHIAEAGEELRGEFERMASQGATPRDYGLRVRSHPVLLITSQAKMRQGFPLDVDYKGRVIETTSFPRDNAVLARNLAAVDAFVTSLGPPITMGTSATQVWERRAPAEVCAFLRNYRTSDRAPRANAIRLMEYIEGRQRLVPPELSTWTVALVSRTPGPGMAMVTLAGRRIACLQRQFTSARDTHFSIKRLLSPSDELLDFTDPAEREKIAADNKVTDFKLIAEKLREARPDTRGLLVIYPLDPLYIFGNEQSMDDHGERRREHLAQGIDLSPPTTIPVGIGLIFPDSKRSAPVPYVVNSVWLQGEVEP